jgi:hypothetical protein
MWLLCKKDIFVNRGKVVLVTSVYLLLAMLFLVVEQRFYFFLILGILIVLIDNYLRYEPRMEALVCSLPVDRRAVVLSRFLTAALLFLLVAGTTYLAAFLVRIIGWSLVMKPLEILSTGDLVLTISLYAMHVSAALLVFSKLGYPLFPKGLIINIVSTLLLWTGFSGLLYIATSLAASDWSLAIAGESRDIGYLADCFSAIIGRAGALWGQSVTLSIFIFVAVLCILISLTLAVKFFRQRDVHVSESDLEVM